MPDREARVEEFFLRAAAMLPSRKFILGGSGWDGKPMPENVVNLGHIYIAEHNAFNSTPRAVLNITRDSMARYGFSPPTRVFEATGTGACIITDAWEGIELFLEPGAEVLLANSGADVAAHLEWLTVERAAQLGGNARRRVLTQHTYAHRAAQLEQLLDGKLQGSAALQQTAPRLRCRAMRAGVLSNSVERTLQRMREQYPDLPMVVLSRTGGEPQWFEVLVGGAIDLLVPPYTEHDLLPAVEYAVASYEARGR